MMLVHMDKMGQCGAACLAMVLGKTLDEVLSEVGDTSSGLDSHRLIAVLSSHGFAALEITQLPRTDIPVILTVPSLNHRGLLHFIVWDGKEYLDPSRGPLRYPDDGYVKDGDVMPPQWASAIVFWPKATSVAT